MSYIEQKHHDEGTASLLRGDFPAWVSKGELVADNPDGDVGVDPSENQSRKPIEPEGSKRLASRNSSRIMTQSLSTEALHPNSSVVEGNSDRENVGSLVDDSFIVTFFKDPLLHSNSKTDDYIDNPQIFPNPKNEKNSISSKPGRAVNPVAMVDERPNLNVTAGRSVRFSEKEPSIIDYKEQLSHNPIIFGEAPSSILSNAGTARISPVDVDEEHPNDDTVDRGVQFAEDDTSVLNEKKLSSSRFWLSGLAVGIAIIIIPLATVCGTGNCQASSTSSSTDSTVNGNSTNMNNITHVRPTPVLATPTTISLPTRMPSISPSPLSTRPPVFPEQKPECQMAVESTEELYDAVGFYMNSGCPGYSMNNWDVSRITDFSRLFDPTRDRSVLNFNENLNRWNTSSAETMFGMFAFNTAFNGKISRWDLSSVTNTSEMFYSATAFNQNISMWDVSNVQSMRYMFFNATSFNQDLCEWGMITALDWDGSSMFNYSGCGEPGDPKIVGGDTGKSTWYSWCQVCM